MADAMQQMYQQVILDHSRERHGAGEIEPFDGESFQVNPTCGDQVTLRVRLDHSAGGPTIAAVGWVGQGCSISQASLSILNDLVTGQDIATADRLNETFRELMHGRGKTLEPAKEEQLEDAAAFVGVAKFPARIKCALLGWMALRDALAHALTAEPHTTDTPGSDPKENA
ncbi:Fe-S cluster assembly sulfur transfer protein SufU [Georgenia yuyongxinii]|uniref:SUF system NifU family Fe-S cluster assembly protein n=1 Tax=Georgenia yuyongxinii TaxID=2589797 RepID=A0A552WSE8_9MICO|nr:SUF system NifU family Fe-S cluster assembly protein [Georgenia yuyongxinii]TRW45761.1 SUF system NifU family Fe-S cluster assembly protein [Georgenia yuyongxinii]